MSVEKITVELSQLKKIIEGAVLASSKPISYERILNLFDEEAKPKRSDLVDAFQSLQQDYQNKGIELQEVASGLRFQVSHSVITWVSRLQEERPQKYSRALLETIAIIAYRQPVTRGGIEDVRGVAVSTHIIKTLQEREWIRVVGHLDVPGRPALYATTRQFLDYFNLKNLNELPALSELKDLEQLNRELDLDEDTAQALQSMIEQEQTSAEANQQITESQQSNSDSRTNVSEEEQISIDAALLTQNEKDQSESIVQTSDNNSFSESDDTSQTKPSL